MSRGLIIGILILLIIGIIGGTAVLIIQRLVGSNTSTNTPTATTTPGFLPSGDEDGDGLSNKDEQLWGANPLNPDTDGDGFKDGEEVLASHNPTIAGPNDTVPAGFVPGQGVTTTQASHPLTINDIIDITTPTPLPGDLNPSPTPLVVDQYFQSPLDLSGGSINLTETYFRQYNTSTINSSVVQFVQLQPLVTKLPNIYSSFIKTAPSESVASIKNYVADVNRYSILSDRNGFEAVIFDLFQHNSTTRVSEKIRALQEYQDALLKMSVPPSAVPVHRLILGYTELLKGTLTNYLLAWNTDKVKALVGIKQIDTADRTYYPLIRTELNRLNSLQ